MIEEQKAKIQRVMEAGGKVNPFDKINALREIMNEKVKEINNVASNEEANNGKQIDASGKVVDRAL